MSCLLLERTTFYSLHNEHLVLRSFAQILCRAFLAIRVNLIDSTMVRTQRATDMRRLAPVNVMPPDRTPKRGLTARVDGFPETLRSLTKEIEPPQILTSTIVVE